MATIRVKVQGESVEALAERYYGDMRKAAIIRAANKMEDGDQPADGVFMKIPGPTVHTVTAGETLQKVADRFLSGDGAAALLAEANGLTASAGVKPGQVLTVFAEVEVRTNNRSAEDLATMYLGDANLGARLRRYNGVKDGAKLPGKTYIPLVGIEPNAGGGGVAVAPVVTPATVVTPAPVVTPTPVAVAPTPVLTPTPVVAPPPMPNPVVAPTPVVAPPTPVLTGTGPVGGTNQEYPVTSKLASLTGFSHAIHAQQLAAHEPVLNGAEIRQAVLAFVAGSRAHDILIDFPESGGNGTHYGHFYSLGDLRLHHGKALGHLLPCPVHIGIVVEYDGDERQTEARETAHFDDAMNIAHGLFHRKGDQAFNVRCTE
jgi:LysM repeat protein